MDTNTVLHSQQSPYHSAHEIFFFFLIETLGATGVGWNHCGWFLQNQIFKNISPHIKVANKLPHTAQYISDNLVKDYRLKTCRTEYKSSTPDACLRRLRFSSGVFVQARPISWAITSVFRWLRCRKTTLKFTVRFTVSVPWCHFRQQWNLFSCEASVTKLHLRDDYDNMFTLGRVLHFFPSSISVFASARL